jgi:hypothetical protein
MLLDPAGTLIRAALLSVALGAVWALLSAGGIYLGARRLPPPIPRGDIWREWRRRRVLWAFCLLVGAAGAFLSTELVIHQFALRDLYWMGRALEVMLICRLGAATGFAAVLFGFTVGAFRRR